MNILGRYDLGQDSPLVRVQHELFYLSADRGRTAVRVQSSQDRIGLFLDGGFLFALGVAV